MTNRRSLAHGPITTLVALLALAALGSACAAGDGSDDPGGSAAEQLCLGRLCVLQPNCASGQTACGNACVDEQTDAANCGACGHACTGGQVCSAGACACPSSASTLCAGTCVDAASDAANCGACGNACPSGQVCTAGACACPSGATLCGGACVDTATDAANCGACGHACGGAQSCSGGACVCPGGQTACGDACVDTSSDFANCGACGHACNAGAVGGGEYCEDGTCKNYAAETFNLVNQARAAGQNCPDGTGYHPPVPALAWQWNVAEAAAQHSQYQASIDTMTHDDPTYGDLGTRLTRDGYAWRGAGENVAAGFERPQDAVAAWLASTHGHCANIMDASFVHAAIWVARSGAGTLYWTQDFGQPR